MHTFLKEVMTICMCTAIGYKIAKGKVDWVITVRAF